jgi:P-type Ca2+ transporter type 2C
MRDFFLTLEAAKALGTDVSRGLDAASVDASRRAHGDNRLPEVAARSIWEMFLGAITDKTLLILLGAAALSIVVEVIQSSLDTSHEPHYLDGIAILCAVAIASLVTTLNEARAAKQFRLLSKVRADVEVKVLRDGHVGKISIFDLVVGDIVYFDMGDRFPADGKLLSGMEVQVDQSTLTGESMPVRKNETDVELLGGTTVTGGNGRMLIEKVGAKSEIGKLQLTLTDEEEDPTPLQERLSTLADRIGLFGLGAAILTFLALAISGFARGQIPLALELDTGAQLLEFLIVAVTIVVVAVPEGLPLAVTISLAYSVQKMAKAKNLVRKLASCETMGAATVICSDKTGTLTKNRMTVVAAHVGGAAIARAPTPEDLSPENLELFADIVSANSTAFLETGPDGIEVYVGNPTECALLSLVAKWGVDWKTRRANAEVISQLGFTSDRKRMSTLVKDGDAHQLLVKGAPEVLIDRAAGLTPADKQSLLSTVQSYSELGHRTLALAHRKLPAQLDDDDPEKVENDLTLLAVVAIADPVRPEVRDAVIKSRAAGVEVKIVTGDNALTAKTIGDQIGLLDGDSLVMEGKDFREKSDEELTGILDRLRILARSVPSDKHRLVHLLKAKGEVVAVTGDGTNDAPALKAADVGFSMGIAGTEVAKEASDIVILDDNFASIVSGIKWGRSIFENIRKFLQFQLTVNVVALTTAFLAAVLGFGIPLNTVQLLWVNLIMDTMAALALATEPPTDDLFDQPPHGRHAPLITATMWINILVMGAVMIGVLFAVMQMDWMVPAGTPHAQKMTFIFNTFVMMQVFNEINARSTRFDRGVLSNVVDSQLFLAIIGVTVAAQVLIVQFGGGFFRTVPLSFEMWQRSVMLGATMLLVGAVVRGVGRLSYKPGR